MPTRTGLSQSTGALPPNRRSSTNTPGSSRPRSPRSGALLSLISQHRTTHRPTPTRASLALVRDVALPCLGSMLRVSATGSDHRPAHHSTSDAAHAGPGEHDPGSARDPRGNHRGGAHPRAQAQGPGHAPDTAGEPLVLLAAPTVGLHDRPPTWQQLADYDVSCSKMAAATATTSCIGCSPADNQTPGEPASAASKQSNAASQPASAGPSFPPSPPTPSCATAH